MTEGSKVPTFMNKLEDILEEYSKRIKQGDNCDAFGNGNESIGGELNCRFKSNCYALRSGQGECPCELNDR